MTYVSPRTLAFAVVCAAGLALGARETHSQSRDSLVVEAVRLRDERNFDAAIRLLGARVARHPDDREAARLLAQTLYWAQRQEEARGVYEQALLRHPADPALRLEYGRMLAELKDGRRAREVLEPLQQYPTMRSHADAVLGTLAYWDGDLVTARRLLRRSLQASPEQPDARRQLREISALTAPWVQTQGEGRADDQPLTSSTAGAEAGWYATPLLSFVARGSAAQLNSADTLALRVTSGELGLTHYLPAARLETELAGGMLQRDVTGAWDWTGRVRVGLRLPGHAALRVSAERAAYLYTVASLRTPVMTRTVRGVLALSSPEGWLGEAAVQREWYPDTNMIGSVYAWLLVPLAHGPNGQLQLGYSGSMQHSDESRFTYFESAEPTEPTQPLPPWSPVMPRTPGGQFAGVYEPYHTPLHLATHSALAAAHIRISPHVVLRASGSYGVAREGAPPPPGSDPAAEPTETRTFFPWTARSSLELSPNGDVTLALAAEAMRTPVYSTAGARLRLTWRFAGASGRSADAR